MNERIREIKDKIWTEEYWTNPNTDKLLPAQLNKFAELIVKECIHELDMCRFEIPRERWMDERNDGIDFCVDTIKKHFGVE